MRVKLIALAILWTSLLSAQSLAQPSLRWSSLANSVFKNLQKKYKDSIAYYRPKCDAVRHALHDLALSTGKDNTTMFGAELEFMTEGMNKHFIQKPPALPYRIEMPDKMVDINNVDVQLFDLDVRLKHWLDAKMVLDRLGKRGLVGILKLDAEGNHDEVNELNSVEDQRGWAFQSIGQHLDHVLRNSPYFWAFKGSGTLRNDAYSQNLQLYKDNSTPVKKPTKQQTPQFQWMLPPVVDSILEFSISSIEGDTLIKIFTGHKSGVLDKQGKMVVPFNYTFINFLPPHWISGESRQKKTWYGRKGETFLHAYENVSATAGGFAFVQKDQKWGILDSQGKTLVPLIYDRYKMNEQGNYIFYKGMDSIIQVPPPYRPTFFNTPNSKYIPPVIPQLILDLKFDQVQVFDSAKGWYQVSKNGLEGLVDSLGQQILPVNYSGLARRGADLIYLYKNRQGGYWIISKNIKVEPQYNSLSPADSSMLAIVGNDTGFGILNLETDSLLFPYSPYEISYRKPYFLLTAQYDTSANHTRFDNIGYLHGLLDEKGKMVEKPDSVEIWIFFNGNYVVMPHYREKSTKYAVLKSAQGKVLRRFQGQYVTTHGPWIRYYDRTYDVKWVSYHHYKKSDALEKTSLLTEELCAVQKGGLWGFTNFRGEEIFPPVFTAVKASKNGLIAAKIDGKWGILKNPLYQGNWR